MQMKLRPSLRFKVYDTKAIHKLYEWRIKYNFQYVPGPVPCERYSILTVYPQTEIEEFAIRNLLS